MKGTGRVYTRLGITLVIAILVASVVPTFVDRRDFVAAVANYERTRHERGVALAREHAENRRIVLLDRLGVATVIFVIVNVGWVLVLRRRNRGPRCA